MSFQPSKGLGASRRDCGKLGFIIPPKPLLSASATCVRASGIPPSIGGKYLFINDWMIGIYRSAKMFEYNFFLRHSGRSHIKVIKRENGFDVKIFNFCSIANRKRGSHVCSEEENQ